MRYLLLLATVFVAITIPVISAASSSNVIISQVQIEGTSVSDEFIELRNLSPLPASLSGWRLQKRTASGTVSSIKSFLGECVSLHPGARLLWANGSGSYAGIADYTTSQSLAKTNTFELVDEKGTVADTLTWGSDAFPKKSMRRDIDTLSWSVSDVPDPTGGGTFCPADEPEEEPEEPSPTIQENTLRINELLPDPDEPGDAGEWIELYNFGKETLDLSGFVIRDGSTAGKYAFPSKTTLPGGGYLVLNRSESDLSLNNTGKETVTLLDAHDTIIDTMSYEGSKEEASLSFDGSEFQWSPFLTPGAENRFPEKPKTKKTSIPKEGFRGVPLEFSADGPDGQKFSWKFGDGKTGRGENVRHTYGKNGRYDGALTISDTDGVAETVKEFTVRIGSFPKMRISITEIAPNPEGPDTGIEWITLKNGWKKDIDLSGWSIATGSGKKSLANHPIRESFVIPEGKEKRLTSDVASFTLPNSGGYVEVRRPDGKMVTGKSYAKSGGAKESEVWRKIAKASWTWTITPPDTTKGKAASEGKETTDEKSGDTEAPEELEETDAVGPKKEATIDDLSPEQLAILEARIEERLRGEILAELESQGRLVAEGAVDTPQVLGVSTAEQEEGEETFLQKANTFLGKLLFENVQ